MPAGMGEVAVAVPEDLVADDCWKDAEICLRSTGCCRFRMNLPDQETTENAPGLSHLCSTLKGLLRPLL